MLFFYSEELLVPAKLQPVSCFMNT